MALTPTPPAGGRATEAGMNFEAMVGTWFAAHLAAGMPVGERFGLQRDLQPVGLQMETGEGLDDIAVTLPGGGGIFIQCKTRAILDKSPESALARTLRQLVEFIKARRDSGASLDPTRVAGILAIGEASARSIDALAAACRQFAMGDTWEGVLGRVAEDQKAALELFQIHVTRAWRETNGAAPSLEDLAVAARLFRVSRFGEELSGADWRQVTDTLGIRLYGAAERGAEPATALLSTVRQLIRSGAAADQDGLIRALRIAGFPESARPGFDDDVTSLRTYTADECVRLDRHAKLLADQTVLLERECLAHLRNGLSGGSLLLIGEPGAGKTGVLVELTRAYQKEHAPTVFLSVDRLAGITGTSDLRKELRLTHELVDVLAAWPGGQPGVLIIDALDASRGGASEAVFAALIELVLSKLSERWSVIASIRTFDLMNGRRFRQAMPGSPPDADYRDSHFAGVRHFLLKTLSDTELSVIGAEAPGLGQLIDTAPTKLRALLHNMFNLSLAADLIRGGVGADQIRLLSTQSELIDRYEDERLNSHALKRAAAAAVGAMAERRRLNVPRMTVAHDDLDGVLHSGVLVEAGDLVSFAHHVLFDHVAGRYYLDWADTSQLTRQVAENPGIGLLFGPALRFAMERVWKNDGAGRPNSWALLKTLTLTDGVDPIVASVALRTVAESVTSPADVQGLINTLRASADTVATGTMLTRLARFFRMTFDDHIASEAQLAWCLVAENAAATGDRNYADGARFLLWTLYEKSAFTDAAMQDAFGRASRELLTRAWSWTPYSQVMTNAAIRCVTKSFVSHAGASRALLLRIFDEPHFTEHAHTEAPSLSEGIHDIISFDPDFAVQIYATLSERKAPQDGKTWIGGQASRLLPLTSNRKQDYELAHWHLSRAIKQFLETAPEQGTVAVISVARGKAFGRSDEELTVQEIDVAGHRIRVLVDYLSIQDWREKSRQRSSSDEDVLGHFVRFLEAAEAPIFRRVVEKVKTVEAGASIWARILQIASERPGLADDLLWPIAIHPQFTSIRGLARDAITYLQRVFPTRSAQEKVAFEAAALNPSGLNEPLGKWWQASFLPRWLSGLTEDALSSEDLKARRRELGTENRLGGNPPFVTIRTSWRGTEGIADSMIADSGANLEVEPNRSIRQWSRSLEEELKHARHLDSQDEIARLWGCVQQVLEAFERAGQGDPHPEVLHAAWGAIGESADLIAERDAYVPEAVGAPSLADLVVVYDRMKVSRYPEHKENQAESGMLAWGNWDVRVHAASMAMHLARRFGKKIPEIFDDLAVFARDPVRTVRLQIAQHVNRLWDVAQDRVWSLADWISRNELSRGVLASFLDEPIRLLIHADRERGKRILRAVVDRLPAKSSLDQGEVPRDYADAVAHIFSWLCVGLDDAWGWEHIDLWTQDLIAGDPYLWAMIGDLRGALIEGFADNTNVEKVVFRTRAKRLFTSVMNAAVVAKDSAESQARAEGISEDQKIQIEALYMAADRLIGHICNQFYFASGAYDHQSHAGGGLETPAQKQAFLTEYSAVFDQIGRYGSADAIHHLIELYIFLVEAAPATVFDRVAAVVSGPAADQQYHFESLGADLLVKLIREYLADHRAIFDDAYRRTRLIAVLETFSSAGWPDALRLLYDLPDLLR